MKTKILILFLLISPIVCFSCTDTITVSAGSWNTSDEKDPEPPTPSGNIVPIASLNNPDRGFHVEAGYFLHNLKEPWADVYYPDGFVESKINIHRAEKDGIGLTQLYVYLTEYVDSEIPQAALDNLQKMFDTLRDKGHKAILRFAYKWNGEGNMSGKESPEWVERHLTQLKPILQKNLGVIPVMQVGFVGTWGEWHSSPMDNDQTAKNRVINALLEAYPAPYCVEIRHPRYKNAFTLTNEAYRNRIGYANDYFTVGEHRLSPDNDFVYGDPAYIELTKESHQYYVSGEIPYSGSTDWEFNTVMPIEKVIVAFRDHHYSAFDISQNFDLNILSWKGKRVSPEWLDNYKILYCEDYFKNEEGKEVVRSFYDFVRDHLGYRLNLLNTSTVNAEGGTLFYDLDITNTGFATVLNPRSVYLVFINENGSIDKEIKLNVNPRDWQPFEPNSDNYIPLIHKIKGSESVGLSGKYKIGLWLPETEQSVRNLSAYDIKFALDSQTVTHWTDDADKKYTVNIIGEVNL